MPPDVRRGLPRCRAEKVDLGCAPGVGSALEQMGAKPKRGAKPPINGIWLRRGKPRLTSGGEAVS
jgi:hypothetical protein